MSVSDLTRTILPLDLSRMVLGSDVGRSIQFMSTINQITGLVVGQYGNSIELTIVDADGVAIDISSYSTSQTVYARSPHDLTTLTFTASFKTTGSDGKIVFSPASGNTFDRKGTWTGQVVLLSASAKSLSVPFEMVVGEALG